VITVRKIRFLVILFSAYIVLACQQGPHEQPVAGKLRVVTTIAPLYSFTKNIAGDAAVVENLLPSNAEPHDYALTPKDAKKVADAYIIIKNGINLETWLDRLMYASQGQVVVDTSSGIDVIDDNPHIWLSPKNAMVQVRNIRDALMKADPLNSETYKENASAYIKRLEALDHDIKDAVVLLKSRKFVSQHAAFLYLARDYGLVQTAVIQETPEVEPSPGHIMDVMNTIKTEDIKFLFSGQGGSHKIMRSIASDLGLNIYPLDTLETGAFSKAWYEDSMRKNIAVIVKAFNE
jgi:zinc/manganese transport system substrate-binding protein